MRTLHYLFCLPIALVPFLAQDKKDEKPAAPAAPAVVVPPQVLQSIEGIVHSMTVGERARPELIDGSRRARIARGSGTNVQAVNRLVKQFGQMRKLMKQMSEGKMPNPEQLMRGAR